MITLIQRVKLIDSYLSIAIKLRLLLTIASRFTSETFIDPPTRQSFLRDPLIEPSLTYIFEESPQSTDYLRNDLISRS